MALPVVNNNGGAPLTTNGVYCAIEVPGFIQGVPLSTVQPHFWEASYFILAGSTGVGTIVTFQSQANDGSWSNLSTVAPITVASSATYNSTIQAPVGSLRLVVSGVVGNGIAYAQLAGIEVLNVGPGLPTPSGVSVNPAQISVYDDFINANFWTTVQTIGAFPSQWMVSATGIGTVVSNSTQNGILTIPPAAFFNSNLSLASGQWPLLYSTISKIVARFVFRVTAATSFSGGNEAVFGFSQTGTASADGSSNLYGAFINVAPNYTAASLPDWDTRAALTTPQLAGLTYGVYAGQYPAAFGYKASTTVTSFSNTAWYEAIISYIPGVSAKFYSSVYGSQPTLDRTCTVAANLTTTNTGGPIITCGLGAGNPGAVLVDKIQYAIWVTEGNKTLSDDQMYAL